MQEHNPHIEQTFHGHERGATEANSTAFAKGLYVRGVRHVLQAKGPGPGLTDVLSSPRTATSLAPRAN